MTSGNQAGEAEGLSPANPTESLTAGGHLLLSGVVLSEGNHRLMKGHCWARRAWDLTMHLGSLEISRTSSMEAE